MLPLVCMILTVEQLDRLLKDAKQKNCVTWNCEHFLTKDKYRPKRCCSLLDDSTYEEFVTYDDGAQLRNMADEVEAWVRKGRCATL